MKINYRVCSKCKKKLRLSEFCSSTRSTYCKNCQRRYKKIWNRKLKNVFSINSETGTSILSDNDMKKELKNFKPLQRNGSRVNALIDFERQFDKVSKIRDYPKPETARIGHRGKKADFMTKNYFQINK